MPYSSDPYIRSKSAAREVSGLAVGRFRNLEVRLVLAHIHAWGGKA